jgi:hypothetical protein
VSPTHETRELPGLGYVLLGLAITAGLIGVEIVLLRELWPAMSGRDWAICVGINLAYVLVAVVVTVNPDHRNMGLFGGLVDNPLSFSDDLNRLMFAVQLLLMPGKLAAWSIASAVRLFLAGGAQNSRRR